MTLHTPTLLMVLILVSGVLWLSVSAASRESQDGMRYWATALALQMGSYVLINYVDQIGEFVAFSGSNLLRSCGWVAFTLGLYQFYGLQPRHGLIGLPVLLITLAFVVLHKHLDARVAVINLLLAAQCSVILRVMWHQRHVTPGRGKYFLVAGLTLATTLLLTRAGAAASGAAPALISLTQSSVIQGLSLLGVLTALLLLAFGFLIMSKDRADDLNRSLATCDELTGLANRRGLNEVLAAEWARAKRSDQPLSVAMIDIDLFKPYNDHYGHQAGDACLRQVAQHIQSSARRTGDLAARYGGEEFLLILPDADADVALRLVQATCQGVAALHIPHVSSDSGHVTVSIGVATLNDGAYKDTEALLRAADKALYRAKALGRNQVHMAEDATRPPSVSGASHLKLMQLIWRRNYECGNPVIDEQHQALFSEVNQLLTSVLRGHPSEEVAALIDAFLINIAQHFQDEEAIFTAAGYPGAAGHAALHRKLLDQAHALTQQFRDSKLPIGELFEFLAHDVVARHILIADRQFYLSLAPQN